MKKVLVKFTLAVFVVLSVVCFVFLMGASADSKTIYLSSAGNALADGTKQKPYGNIDDAIKAVSGGGTIVIMDKYTVGSNGTSSGIPTYTEPAHAGKIKFTSVDSSTDYRKNGAALHFSKKMAYQMSGSVLFEEATIQSDNAEVFFAAHFKPVEFGVGFAAKNTKSTAKFLYAIGGYFAPINGGYPSGLNASITIRSGDFYRVMGFAHSKGAKTYTFTGTASINVYGGSIDRIYCGSTLNHYSGSVDYRMWGGVVGDLYTAGDASRRLDGKANVELRGGRVSNLFINNVIGNVTLTLDSTILGSMKVSYATDEIKDLAYDSEISVKYNSVFYTASFVSSVKEFDSIEKYGVIYVSQSGTGDGKSPDKPTSDLSKAIGLLSKGGGKIQIDGSFTLGDFSEPAHSEAIEIYGGEIKLNGNYTLGGDTTFGSCKIDAKGYFDANGHKLEFDRDIDITGTPDLYVQKNSGALKTEGRVVVFGGSFGDVYASSSSSSESSSSIELLGGRAENVCYCGSGASLKKSTVLVSGAEVKNILSGSGKKLCALALELSGKIGTLKADNSDSLSVRLGKAEIGSVEIKTEKAKSTIVYDASYSSVIDGIKDSFSAVTAKKTVYVSNGGDGDGFSALHPVADLVSALNCLKDSGGELVLCGDVYIKKGLELPACSGKLSISSVDGAALHVGANVHFFSEVEIDNIKIISEENGVAFIFNGNKASILDNTVTEKKEGVDQYVTLVAGSTSSTKLISTSDLTVNAGKWQKVYGGSTATGYYINADFNLTVNGGEFYGFVACSGCGNQTGNTNVTLNGGTFYGNVYATYTSAGTQSYLGNISLTLNGGNYYGKIRLGVDKGSNFTGKYDVYVNGGDFSHLTDIEGSDGYIGRSESNIHIGEGVDINLAPEGTITYQNPIRRTADPRIILVDGMYYYVFTSGATLRVYKAANITDLAYSVGELVWDARQYAEALEGRISNIWPSELMYFSADEFGEENEGWYLFFSTYVPEKDGGSDGSTRRSYVLKCNNKNLQGNWVNPITGETGVPEKFASDTYDWVNNSDWTAGESTLRYNGEVYAVWIGQTGRQTKDFKQTMYLSKMKNPWTVTGPVLELVNPEYDWERVGYGYDAANDLWYPAVIEGATPLVSDDNTLYVLYAASGYWTTAYSLGQMKFLGGDMFDINNWQKSPTPIFSKNSEVNGVGGPSLISMPDGSGRYIMYHGYIGKDTSSGRYCFLEELKIDENGVHIGVDGHPSPLATKHQIMLNPTPLAKKISGFDNYTSPVDDVVPDTLPPVVDTPEENKPLDMTLVLVLSLVAVIILADVLVLVILKSKNKNKNS